MPTVSVVIPAYNAGHLVDAAIASVLSQDWPADEIIVVNDGSTDRDYGELQRLDPRVRVLSQPNRGVSAARNAGCEAATSEYIAILDADDLWLPWKLGVQMRRLSLVSIDAIFCKALHWVPAREGALSIGKIPVDREVTHLTYADFLCSFPAGPSTMVVKRSVWRELGGFDETLRYGEDHDFYLRLSHGYPTAVLQMRGTLYRQHGANATAEIQTENHWANVREKAVRTLGMIDRFGNRVDPKRLAAHSAFIHFQHGYAHFWNGSFRVARAQFLRMVTLTPRNYKGWVYVLLSCAPGLRSLARLIRAEGRHDQGTFRMQSEVRFVDRRE